MEGVNLRYRLTGPYNSAGLVLGFLSIITDGAMSYGMGAYVSMLVHTCIFYMSFHGLELYIPLGSATVQW